jgi:hypothetical protein
MWDRILKGWTFQRAFYLLVGGAISVYSLLQQEWIGLAIGSYFGAMGLFSFGCAAGNCAGGTCGPAETDTESKY